MKKLFLKNNKWLLTLLWCLVQLSLFLYFGVKVVFDSHRYLAEANRFLTTGDFSNLKISFINYTFILAAFLKITNSINGVIIFQITLAGIATIAFYKAALYLWSSRWYASLATAIFILWPDFHLWNFYVHTESLFVSGTILLFYRLISAQDWKAYLQVVLLLLFVMFLRPNGFMIAIAVVAYLIALLCVQKGLSAWILAICIISIVLPLMIFVTNFFLKNFTYNNPLGGHLNSDVIQGYTKLLINSNKNLDFVRTGTPLEQVLQLIVIDPAFFINRSALRLIFYWAHLRPYYSDLHNLVILLYMYPAYLLAMLALWKKLVPVPVAVFIIVLGLQLSAMVVVSGVDWDNRFIMPMLPFIFLLAGAGAGFITTESKHNSGITTSP